MGSSAGAAAIPRPYPSRKGTFSAHFPCSLSRPQVIWALGFWDPYYHNYYLAATLASLGGWLLLLDLFVWRRWTVAKRAAVGKQQV